MTHTLAIVFRLVAVKIVSVSSLFLSHSNSKHEGEKQINFRFLLSDLAPKVNNLQQDDREDSEDDTVASTNLPFGLHSVALETIRA